jgi:hypothetical protein
MRFGMPGCLTGTIAQNSFKCENEIVWGAVKEGYEQMGGAFRFSVVARGLVRTCIRIRCGN